MKVRRVEYEDKCLYFDKFMSIDEVRMIMGFQGCKDYKIDEINAVEVKYTSENSKRTSAFYKYFENYKKAIIDIDYVLSHDFTITNVSITL